MDLEISGGKSLQNFFKRILILALNRKVLEDLD